MRAAVSRSTFDGRVVGPDERVDALTALALFLSHPSAPGGPPRRVEVGAPADVCLLGPSFEETIRDLDPGVAVTIVGGRIVSDLR